ncbi:putative glutathione S-transferase DHAR1, cytosolic [Psilocybe cubensis]|uniref:Glutathione S-transferase DHAR1, cytosolic n=1 Tax=Psilocybe cubensis TaxID=181762 RepID=A0ACB8GPQ8_PSICU|nr:putative glutathione S-transferase DHAR1, cytosolic [Psilocybe cubensis]KAH9477357.1 putative glutathione S-transferase DHAR1, cytosolic [Psilocybe cubensis]
MTEQITLYTAKVELALSESKLPYKRFEIDLQNKPEWYAPKVNPASKVPAISYGGPDVPPEDPSPDSQKIAESYVLLQFFADISEVPLLPKDPILRAKARFFVETVTPKAFRGYYTVVAQGEDPELLLDSIETVQSLLPAEGYAVGEWSIADAAITPFFARAEVAFKNDIGKFANGAGQSTWAKVENDDKYARFRKYFNDIKSRDSFKQTFDADYIKETFMKRFAKA